ncbi:MAG TPA: DUF1638 domain-containing protein [Candidatus Limnocylindrales bacterium]|jgi:hypothetical protein|nr:DUF1638 domain-containing protein [Candidatus Limnocylindrales bacterium]
MFLKVIACEIAVRELYYTAARSSNLIDLEFLTQGHHDTPHTGRVEIQKRIDAVPAGKYDAILLGYGLCSNILSGLTASHTKLVIPRAHDCITFFLGSKDRYQHCFAEHPGTYYYTSGWLECAKRRGNNPTLWGGAAVPAGNALNLQASYAQWVKQYGEDQAKYLLEEMGRWTQSYSNGTLINFEFLKNLKLAEEVKKICADKGWDYSEIPGNLRLLQELLDGQWPDTTFLVVAPGQKVIPSYDERIIVAE